MQQLNDTKLHAVLLGASGTGKTLLKQRLFTPTFSLTLTPHHAPTVGIDFKKVNKLVLWDTSGAARHNTITDGLIQGKSIAIFVFNDRASFNALRCIHNNTREINPDIHEYLLIDMQLDKKTPTEVPTEEVERFAKENNIAYFSVSVKKNQGIEAVENHLTQIVQTLKPEPASDTHQNLNAAYSEIQENSSLRTFFSVEKTNTKTIFEKLKQGIKGLPGI